MIDKKTISKLFKYRVQSSGNKKALGRVIGSKVTTLSFNEYHQLVSKLSLAFLKLDLQKGDSIAILADTSLEWHLMDMSAMSVGIVTVPIYPTALANEVKLICEETNSKFLIIDTEMQLEKLLEMPERPKSISRILTLFSLSKNQLAQLDETDLEVCNYTDLLELGDEEINLSPELFNIRSNVVDENDVATIIYTSGTTGKPRGAVITQLAFTQMLLNLQQSFSANINEKDRSLIELPLSHVLGRCNSYLHLPFGLLSIFGQGLSEFTTDCSIAKPTIAMGVPRIFEKIHSRLLQKLHKSTSIEQKSFEWACDVSETYFNKIDDDLSPSTLDIVTRNLAFKTLFQPLYNLFGGELRYFICGGAPLKKEIASFLRYINLTILEGYGLTETIGPCIVNPIRKSLPGAVGLPIGDVKVKLSEEGEILINSKAIFSGYLGEEDQVFDEEGWFHTGDIGELSTEGYLKITDRKKDIIVTSNGKNVSPQKIETIVSGQPHIDQFILIGESRHFLAGIVVLNKEELEDVLESCGLNKTDSLETIAKNKDLRDIIQQEISNANAGLPSHEQIKKFIISTRGISLFSGHMTPSLKIKRQRVLEEFKEEIDALYQQRLFLT